MAQLGIPADGRSQGSGTTPERRGNRAVVPWKKVSVRTVAEVSFSFFVIHRQFELAAFSCRRL